MKPCPRDTDGDGNCGRPSCSFCGVDAIRRVEKELRAALLRIAQSVREAYVTCDGCGKRVLHTLPLSRELQRIAKVALHDNP